MNTHACTCRHTHTRGRAPVRIMFSSVPAMVSSLLRLRPQHSRGRAEHRTSCQLLAAAQRARARSARAARLPACSSHQECDGPVRTGQCSVWEPRSPGMHLTCRHHRQRDQTRARACRSRSPSARACARRCAGWGASSCGHDQQRAHAASARGQKHPMCHSREAWRGAWQQARVRWAQAGDRSAW
jgi:hypothetical protein